MLSLLLGVGLGVGLGWFALKLRLGWEFQSGFGSSGGGVWILSWGFIWDCGCSGFSCCFGCGLWSGLG